MQNRAPSRPSRGPRLPDSEVGGPLWCSSSVRTLCSWSQEHHSECTNRTLGQTGGAICHRGVGDPGKVRLAPSPPSQRRFETQLETAGRPEASGRGGRSSSSPRPVTDLSRPTPAPRWGHAQLSHRGFRTAPCPRPAVTPCGSGDPGGAQGSSACPSRQPAASQGREPAGALTPPVPSLSAWGRGPGRGRSRPGLQDAVSPLLAHVSLRLSRLQPFLSLCGEASGDTRNALFSPRRGGEPRGAPWASRGCPALRPLPLLPRAACRLPVSSSLSPRGICPCPHTVCPHTVCPPRGDRRSASIP